MAPITATTAVNQLLGQPVPKVIAGGVQKSYLIGHLKKKKFDIQSLKGECNHPHSAAARGSPSSTLGVGCLVFHTLKPSVVIGCVNCALNNAIANKVCLRWLFIFHCLFTQM